MLRVSDLDYRLPPELVATHAVEPRDAARLLVVSRSQPSVLHHACVRDLPTLLKPADLLVTNVSKVIPARIVGVRADTNGAVEGLYLGPSTQAPEDAPPTLGAPDLWRVMLKGRRLRPGIRVDLFDIRYPERGAAGVSLELVDHSGVDGEDGTWIARMFGPGVAPSDSALSVLERLGGPPLPPYIRAARKRAGAPETINPSAPSSSSSSSAPALPPDIARYQTVYADAQHAGSIAAPTAGLHFTPGLLERLAAGGIARHPVVLHVGTGTFKPVATEFIEQHAMHSEWCHIPAETCAAITSARARDARIVAIGTTSARTLESFPRHEIDRGAQLARWTRILIAPGHTWANVDALFTNFHLPCSTLMAMVASFLETPGCGVGSGVERLRRYYELAVHEKYRFYSYGDAMLILP